MVKNLKRSVSKLKPYVPGATIEEVKAKYGLNLVIKLGSNEHPFGPSPAVIAAMRRAVSDAHLYAKADNDELTRVVADKLGVSDDHILFGNGSDNCMSVIVQTFLNEEDVALIPWPTFGMYETVVRVVGAQVELVQCRDLCIDLKQVLSRVDKKTKLVFLCNPNNPTGTIFSGNDLKWFLSELPDDVYCVVDEAYGEFVTDERYPDIGTVVSNDPRVIGLRTFSKVYGLAGMRLGYIIAAPEVISYLRRVREPLCLNSAVIAGGIAAMGDQDHFQRTLELVRASRDILYQGLTELGVDYIPTHTNFVLCHVERDAIELAEKLKARGVIIRPGTAWGLTDWIRISLGMPADIELLLSELGSVL